MQKVENVLKAAAGYFVIFIQNTANFLLQTFITDLHIFPFLNLNTLYE